MKLPKACKIELAASTDVTRTVLREPYLVTDSPITKPADGSVTYAGKLVATNGRMLAVIPVELNEHDKEEWVNVEALSLARKAVRKGESVNITLNDQAEIAGSGIKMKRSAHDLEAESDKYPNWRQVIPQAEETDTVVCFDAELLVQLVAAIGTRGVQMRIPKGSLGCITIEPITDEHIAPANVNARGYLMPMRQS